ERNTDAGELLRQVFDARRIPTLWVVLGQGLEIDLEASVHSPEERELEQRSLPGLEHAACSRVADLEARISVSPIQKTRCSCCAAAAVLREARHQLIAIEVLSLPAAALHRPGLCRVAD